MERQFTPIVKSNMKQLNNNIYIKRDDLYPLVFGGNKARIVEKLVEDAVNKKCNHIIGYGSTSSNMNRALANYCKIKNISCTIICNKEHNESMTNNSRLIELTSAKVVYCDLSNVAKTVEDVMKDIEESGQKPYYIYGNKYGKGNEKVSADAYIDVYNEILEQEKQLEIQFDYIFCGTGTGMTQSGLIIGKVINNKEHKIVGISVAREADVEIPILLDRINVYFDNKNSVNEDVIFYDKVIGKGYGVFTDELKRVIKESLESDGIPLDITYTGKAFMGMRKYLMENNIKNKNILFIHTGGTPLFFDDLDVMTAQ